MKQFSALPFKRMIFRGSICNYAAAMAWMVVLATAAVPTACHAKSGESALVLPAGLTQLTALSDSTIAIVTGTGLRGPSIGGTSEPRAPITLWDELRPTAHPPLAANSNSVITINGVLQ